MTIVKTEISDIHDDFVCEVSINKEKLEQTFLKIREKFENIDAFAIQECVETYDLDIAVDSPGVNGIYLKFYPKSSIQGLLLMFYIEGLAEILEVMTVFSFDGKLNLYEIWEIEQ